MTTQTRLAFPNFLLMLLFFGLGGCQQQSDIGYVPGLGEVMTAIQMRHSKLWFAGQATNWQLANYELFEIEEGFENAMTLHPERSKLLPKLTSEPMAQLQQAISAKDSSRFVLAFDAFTQSCNACHTATEFTFNRVIIPSENPFTNQDFSVDHHSE